MSSSTVTYILISSDYEELSDVGSPEVVVYGYEELPMHPVDPYVEAALQAPEQVPPSPDYVSGPEQPPSPDYVPCLEEPEHASLSPVYVPELEYPEYLVPSNAEAPIEDPEEDLEEDPVDEGDDVDDKEDEEDEQEASKDDEDKEEQHSALVDSFVVLVDDPIPSAKDTEAFETDESAPTPLPSPRRRTARMSIPSPPLPLPSPPTTSLTYAEAPLGYRAAGIRLRAASPSNHHPSEIPSQPLVTDLATTQRQDAYELYIRYEDAQDNRALLGDQKMPPKKRTATTTTTTTPMTNAQLKVLIAQGVADALAERGADRSKNGDDSHDLGSDERRRMPVARECTYSDFLKCQPLNFKGTEGVVGLTQSLKNIESVFHISNCTTTNKVKFATYTLQGNALTWWNSHVNIVTHEVAYGMTWKALKKMMTNKYCPRGEIKKSSRYDESVMASKPKTIQDAIDFATELMDQKIHTLAECQDKNKRKFEDTSRNNQNQQQPFKRYNVARAYTTGPREKKSYGGSKPLCPKCNYHHDEQYAPKCTNCKRTGHSAWDCRS
nr:hypothetical protein [Tanacetum cinerariifolium]